MTEGRGTGIPKIIHELKKNESPLPIFITDKERSFLVVELPIHVSFKQDTLQENKRIPDKVQKLFEKCDKAMTRKELMSALKLKSRSSFIKHYLNPALELGLIGMTIPDNPNNRNQKYKVY